MGVANSVLHQKTAIKPRLRLVYAADRGNTGVGSNQDGTVNVSPANSDAEAARKRRDSDAAVEAELVARTADGDSTAYRILVDRQVHHIYAVARRMLGDEAEAEDIVQEVFLRLWKNAGKFDPEKARLSTWLHRVTSNLCIDRLRGRRTEQLDEKYEASYMGDQDTNLQNKALTKRLQEVMTGLPERQRLALVLFHYEGHSMKETGDILEISVEAVESLLARGRRTMKQKLKAEWTTLLPDAHDN
ncbi:MAG: RNA polymerase sigma factor [Methyloligellaceae bacterium]